MKFSSLGIRTMRTIPHTIDWTSGQTKRNTTKQVARSKAFVMRGNNNVCVCNPWNQREPLGLEQGDWGRSGGQRRPPLGSAQTYLPNWLPVVLAVVCFHGGSCGSVTNRYSRFVF